MKYKAIIALLCTTLVGCETVKQAKTDYRNFVRTVKFNAGQPIVLKSAVF